MTPASFRSVEQELPRRPSAVYKEEATIAKQPPRNNLNEQHLSEKPDDGQEPSQRSEATLDLNAEAQAPSLTYTWQQRQCTPEDRRNETRRAQYDLYPRT